MFHAGMSIHCSTREEAEALMQLFAVKGICWSAGQSPLELVLFNPEAGTWYSIHKNDIRNPFGSAESELIITYSHGVCGYKMYEQIEYTELVEGTIAVPAITSIDDFI